MTQPSSPDDNVEFPDGPLRPTLEQVMAKGPQPLAYLIPKLMTFKDGPISTNCPPLQQLEVEGTVGWQPSIFDEGRKVTDRNGVEHRPLALGRFLTSASVAHIKANLKKLVINGCTCGTENKTVVVNHAEDCSLRIAYETTHLVDELVRHSSSRDPD